MVYKLKRDRLGNVIRHKCRLVAQCFFQVFGQDYTDTYSPVAKNMSIRKLLAISAQLRLQDIWVQVPQGTDLPSGDNGIYKLKKSLYGLKQAPREWNECINNFLVNDLHFKRLEADPCIYKKTDTYVEKGVTKYKYSLVAL